MRRIRPTLAAVLTLSALVLLTACPAHAAFPGVNGRIVYSLCQPADTCTNFNVFGANPDGSGVADVFPAATTPFSEDPAYSADGRLIAAQSCVRNSSMSFNCGLSLIAANGTGERTLTPITDGANDDYPAFAPDGLIAFSRGFGDSTIWVVNLDGSNAHALTSGSGQRDADPRFSPDGQTIVFDRFITGPGEEHIWAMNRDGSGPHPLTTDGTAQDESPDFSPDGSTIIFSRCPASGSCAIFAADANGANPHAISTPPTAMDDYEPAFSPDGTKIAFERYDETAQTYTVEVELLATGNAAPLTTGSAYRPAWGRVPTPSIDTPPTIAGSVRLGHTLTATSGPTPWGGTASFQWLRCNSAGSACAPIAGATATSYQLANADKDKRLLVRQTQTSAGGSATSDSATTGKVRAEPGAAIAARGVVRGGKALIKLTCSALQKDSCAGTLTLTASPRAANASRKRMLKVGKAKFRIKAGKHKTIKVKLSKKARAALAAKGKLKVKAITVAKDSAGNRTTVRKTITLKPKSRKKKRG